MVFDQATEVPTGITPCRLCEVLHEQEALSFRVGVVGRLLQILIAKPKQLHHVQGHGSNRYGDDNRAEAEPKKPHAVDIFPTRAVAG
jgi:hypothetical protein